jgi:hypothetical protein
MRTLKHGVCQPKETDPQASETRDKAQVIRVTARLEPDSVPSLLATLLIGKMKLFIFEEMIHEDNELAHAGCQGDQRFFTCGSEALIKILEDPVMADGAEGSHIEGATHWSSTAADMPPTRVVTTIAIVGGHAGQGGRSLRGEMVPAFLEMPTAGFAQYPFGKPSAFNRCPFSQQRGEMKGRDHQRQIKKGWLPYKAASRLELKSFSR